MMIFSEIFEKAALLNFFAPEVSSTDDSFLKADAFKPFAAYRRRTTPPLFRAKKRRENAFLTLPAAGQSAPAKLSTTPMPVQVFLRVRTIHHANTLYRSLRAKLGNPL